MANFSRSSGRSKGSRRETQFQYRARKQQTTATVTKQSIPTTTVSKRHGNGTVSRSRCDRAVHGDGDVILSRYNTVKRRDSAATGNTVAYFDTCSHLRKMRTRSTLSEWNAYCRQYLYCRKIRSLTVALISCSDNIRHTPSLHLTTCTHQTQQLHSCKTTCAGLRLDGFPPVAEGVERGRTTINNRHGDATQKLAPFFKDNADC